MVTVNVAEAKSEVEPVTLIECAPSAALATTVNDPLTEPPLVNVQVGAITMSGDGVLLRQPVMYVPTSPDANPFPLIDTTVPTTPAKGLSVIEGAVGGGADPFVKPVDAESAGVPPFTVTVYGPSRTLALTWNAANTVPSAFMVHVVGDVGKVTVNTFAGLDEKALQGVGPPVPEKPAPPTVITAPPMPEFGFTKITGTTANEAGAFAPSPTTPDGLTVTV